MSSHTAAPGQFHRAVTTALVGLDLKHIPNNWTSGPLASTWRAAQGKPVDGTIQGRKEYINPGLEDVLYRRNNIRVIRWHCTSPKIDTLPVAAQLEAMELLLLPFRYPFPSALLYLHFRLDPRQTPAELQRTLNYLTNHNRHHAGGFRNLLSALVAPWATVNARHRRAQHVTLLTKSTEDWPPPAHQSSGTEGRANEWLYCLCTSGRYRPDPDSIDRHSIDSPEVLRVWMSDNLRGAVSRDGFAMIGLKEDTGGIQGRLGFDYDGAEFFAKGLYSDVLALSTIQRVALDALELDLSQVYVRGSSSTELLALEEVASSFRTRVWRKDFAPQGSQDEVLTRLQAVQQLTVRETDLSRNIAELSARYSRIEQNRIAELLRILTLVGAMWGFVWALLLDWKVPWREWVLIGTFAGVVLIVSLHPGLRPALGLRRSRVTPVMHIDWDQV